MAKTAQKKTVEELIKKSEKALGDPKLVEIVQNAPLTKDGKVNLTKVHDQAFEHVFNKTKDLQKAKEFATSTRWLAMMKRDYLEEFKKVIFEKAVSVVTLMVRAEQKSQPKPEPKDVEIRLCGDVILGRGSFTAHSLRIKSADMPNHAIIMAGEFLRAGTNIVFKNDNTGVYNLNLLRDYLIKILEEKFGMKMMKI